MQNLFPTTIHNIVVCDTHLAGRNRAGHSANSAAQAGDSNGADGGLVLRVMLENGKRTAFCNVRREATLAGLHLAAGLFPAS